MYFFWVFNSSTELRCFSWAQSTENLIFESVCNSLILHNLFQNLEININNITKHIFSLLKLNKMIPTPYLFQ